MCNKCPKVHDHKAKGFWVWAAGRPCECSCSGADVQIVQEREDRYIGNDVLGRPNLVPEYRTVAYCTKCKHKFRM